jgi:hypothetical protein
MHSSYVGHVSAGCRVHDDPKVEGSQTMQTMKQTCRSGAAVLVNRYLDVSSHRRP